MADNNSTLSIKRKAEEAFDALDDALRTEDSRPSPPKRANTSFYSSLTKYGLFGNKPKPKFPEKSSPTLVALLSRTRRNKQTTIPHTSDTASNSKADYSPGSTDAFLKRLATYHYSTYSSKPQPIDAVAASKAGWVNEGGKERLYCGICRIGWVVAGRDGMTKEAAAALVEKQAEQLVIMHKEGCPWRTRQCDPLVYRIPLQSPANLARKIKANALEINTVMDGIPIRHPLTTSQVQSFSEIVLSVLPPSNDPQPPANTETLTLSSSSILTSLFGWTLVPIPPPMERKSSSSASLVLSRAQSRPVSRETTPAPSMPDSFPLTPNLNRILPGAPTTPSLSRNKSVMGPPSSPFRPPQPQPNPNPPSQKDAMLQCKMCLRRLGLWAFAPSTTENHSSQPSSRPPRQFDLLREHRPTCPYVAKSTPLATLPHHSSVTSPNIPHLSRARTSLSLDDASSSSTSVAKEGLRRTASFLSNLRSSSHSRTPSLPSLLQDMNLVEGWRAVYNTVMRYGMAERAGHMASRNSGEGSRAAAPSVDPMAEGVEPMDTANDDAMSEVVELVEEVKQHGGRQLLLYVKNLLG